MGTKFLSLSLTLSPVLWIYVPNLSCEVSSCSMPSMSGHYFLSIFACFPKPSNQMVACIDRRENDFGTPFFDDNAIKLVF